MAQKAIDATKAAAKKETSFQIIKSNEAGHEVMFMAAHAANTLIEIDKVERDGVSYRAVAITSVEPTKTVCSNPLKDGYMLRGRDLLTNAPLVSWVYVLKTDPAPIVGSHRSFPAINIPKGHVALQREWKDGVVSETAMTCLKSLTDSSFVGAPKGMVELLLAETAAAMITAPTATAEAPAVVAGP